MVAEVDEGALLLAGRRVRLSELGSFTHEPKAKAGASGYRQYYLRKWASIAEGRTRWGGFNWAALFFGALWCLWRRLYLWALGVWLAEISLTFALSLAVVLARGLANPRAPIFAGITVLSWLTVRVPFAAFANRVYLSRALASIERVGREVPEPEARLAALERSGGTSGIALTLGIAAQVILQLWDSLTSVGAP